MGRSNPDPVLRKTPGARFTTTLLAGSEKPHERSAAFTRSRDSHGGVGQADDGEAGNPRSP